jgi:glutathione-independent formaldehyde dehydrogenase
VGATGVLAAAICPAAAVVVSDLNEDRLAHARSVGFETINPTEGGSIPEQLEAILGVPEVDCGVDCVGYEAKGHGGGDQPAVVLNQLTEATRAAGAIGIPGLYVTEDPGAPDEASRQGTLSMRFGLGWAKSLSYFTGQTPVMSYNRGLMMAILGDRVQIARAVNVEVISLDEAPAAYQAFDRGAPKKYVIDPHNMIRGGA